MPTHSVDQLKRAVLIAEQIQKLQAELNAILGTSGSAKPSVVTAAVVKETKPAKKKGKMSAAGRAAIVAAQKARWAKVKGEATTAPVKAKPAKAKKKTMSPEARAKIAAAAKKRWAEKKAGK